MSLTTNQLAEELLPQRNGHASSRTALKLQKKLPALKKGLELAELDEQRWTRWRKHLAQRKQPLLPSLTGTRGYEALLWGLPVGELATETETVLKQLTSLTSKKPAKGKKKAPPVVGIPALAASWLHSRAHDDVDVSLAVECLAWTHALPKLAAILDASQWLELLQSLLQVAEDAAAIDVQTQPLLHQMAAGELALTLGCALPEIDAPRAAAKSAKAALSQGVTALLDGEGQLAAEHLDLARPLLACWTRAALLADAAGQRAFKADAQAAYEWYVRQSLRMMRRDGSQMLSTNGHGDWSKSLFDAALQAGGDTTDRTLAKLSLPRKSAEKVSAKAQRQLPEAATNSEWATMALLRSSWRPEAARLLLDYSRETIRSELFVDRNVIWSGACSPRIWVNGEPLQMTTPWEEICWHSDEDADYVEIEATFAGDWKCQRQFLLAHEDRVLLTSDAVLGPESATVEYACDWPIVPTLATLLEEETTECALAAGKSRVARALPLALPEWKCDGRRAGALTEADGALRYSLRREGQRLYAPLWWDLDRGRLKYPYTWRQLSVGRHLEPVPLDEAVGYRVQLRMDQWMLYRSLAPQASRTVLGQNYFYEFVCGRFDRFGDVEPLIEVE